MDVLLQAFALGALGGVIPGSILTILLLSSIQGGFKSAAPAFFWSMLSELIITSSLLLVAAQLPLGEKVFTLIGVVGGLVLLYFAWQVLQLRAVHVQDDSVLFTPAKIFLLAATNAPLYIFWTTVCFPLIWKLASVWGLPLAAFSYLAVFEIGWGITTFVMLLLFVFSRKTLTNEHVMHKVFVVIALLLASFGIHMLIQSLSTIL